MTEYLKNIEAPTQDGFQLINSVPADDVTNSHIRKILGENDLHVSRAQIYRVFGPKDNRLQVLPDELFGIPENEYEYLPLYPPLIQGQFFTGRSIDVHGNERADFVWILSTSDFSVGYVIGRSNAYGENTEENWPYSFDFDQIKKYYAARGLSEIDTDYRNYDVLSMVAYSDSGIGTINLLNRENGDWFILNTSGTTIVMSQQKIYIRVGSPSSVAGTQSVYSEMNMTPEHIIFKTQTFEVDAKKVILGRHGLNLASMAAGVPGTCKNGPVVSPIENIFV